jgi:hypothetical protein
MLKHEIELVLLQKLNFINQNYDNQHPLSLVSNHLPLMRIESQNIDVLDDYCAWQRAYTRE